MGFLADRIAGMIAESGFRPTLVLDGALQPRAATADLLRELERCEPFGMGNTAPALCPGRSAGHGAGGGRRWPRCACGWRAVTAAA